MIKLVAIDLDGSLLTDKKEFPSDFWAITDMLLDKDVKIVIASGRPYHNVVHLFDRIKDRLYFASDNGTQVLFRDKELLENQIAKTALGQFVDISRGLSDVYPILCGKRLAFIENTEDKFVSAALRYFQNYKVVPDLKEVDDVVVKISMCDLVSAETNSYPHYKNYERDFTVAVAGPMWLDITNVDGTKGNALKALQHLLNIRPEETLAFGDYLNDLDMIQNAGFGYVMKNAHPQLLRVAKHVTKFDNNHFGVTETLKELFSL